ncbi:delta 1-pyrroline-5-carboxylate synthetase [Methylophaga frappieri]|uniref:Delta 1-pyrroline-5-carboxylate synthetase n=1 Tax=Methylophaga frappieri (strain ATCC BAA-2434 / DSM 25690 / JAM7) TaxID=754477 RepID=I1YJ28_METFJ|nr:delta 1-pyrroline-5-carboxylate synthetase [Methylophaga frappieri]AFJ02921.1 delta 1-pyrroline-5-carboxylate synthetase [Methylophaga frappieri]
MSVVVKLGGSLYRDGFLAAWLKTLTGSAQTQQIIIVPGGGPFANTVRTAQTDYPMLSQTAAHRMALLAMRQYGLLLNDLTAAAETFTDSNQKLPATGLFIWLPDDEALLQTDLPHSWQLTSDSLALWLTAAQGLKELLLVKSAAIDSDHVEQLTASGIIDGYFGRFFEHFSIPCSVTHAADFEDFLSKKIPLR